MNAYQSAIRNNSSIAHEAATHGGSLVNKKDETPFFRPKSKENADRERTIMKYEGRKNSCPVCHTARSVTGECALCD